MTTKNKAKDIFSQMLNAGKGITTGYLAGECAIIAVNELIEVTDENTYWIDVKKELKKLLNYK